MIVHPPVRRRRATVAPMTTDGGAGVALVGTF
jgi:hypothetical protein